MTDRLLLPDMRAALRLSVAAIGATAAAPYAAYLAVTLCTGALVARYGPRATVVPAPLLATAPVAVDAAPEAVVAGVVAAVLFGAAYNILVAIQGLWSIRIFGHPASGLAAVMSAMGVGFLCGPLLAGQLDQRMAFMIAAALLAAAGALGMSAPHAEQGDSRRARSNLDHGLAPSAVHRAGAANE